MNDSVQRGSVFDESKDIFRLGVGFHWSLARIIFSIIFERVDNRKMGRWPFPLGLAIGMTIVVVHCSGFPSVQDWLNKLMILFIKERGALV